MQVCQAEGNPDKKLRKTQTWYFSCILHNSLLRHFSLNLIQPAMHIASTTVKNSKHLLKPLREFHNVRMIGFSRMKEECFYYSSHFYSCFSPGRKKRESSFFNEVVLKLPK